MIHDEVISILPYLVPPVSTITCKLKISLLYSILLSVQLLEDEEVLQYIDGVAVHWYEDGNYDPNIRLLAHSNKEGFFVINSETCKNFW